MTEISDVAPEPEGAREGAEYRDDGDETAAPAAPAEPEPEPTYDPETGAVVEPETGDAEPETGEAGA